MTGPRDVPDAVATAGVVALPAVEGIGCRYGGEYPYCRPAPPAENPGPGGSVAEPSAPPTGGTPPQAPPDTATRPPCQTGDAVVDNPAFAAAARDLWARSNYGPSIPQANRLEQYVWVVKTASGYSFPPVGVPAAPCGFAGAVTVTPPPGTVAFLHTHPWTRLETQTSCGSDAIGPYLNLPSQDDVAASTALGMPGYIIDANLVTLFDGKGQPSQINSVQNQFARCGY